MSALDIVSTWPVNTAAVAVVDAKGVRDRTGPDVALPWASVTKLLTALTVLVAVDRGDVTLDEPAGPEGATVRHLLAHTSGVAFDDDSRMAAPGRKRVYSNRGFELLADFVLTRTGGTFAELMTESVLRPLGMGGTRLAGSPAAGAIGPVSDLALLGQELLDPTLAPDLMAEATTVQFPGVSGVLPGFGRQDPNDWGLGFEIRDGKQPHWTGSRNSPATFGHFGRTGTFLWVDPRARLAVGCLTDRDFGDWAAEVWPALSDAVLAEHRPEAP
ncbi:serine hydrolase domain-containing protein [Dactylosporangium fulvum]|uniref:Beta-lactamase family protein n=1 Tax=Dactylosporangium fulvum TaxID=53359 RepID=A0ABY5WAN2_9ACTN|nr:serine hydrolase domain-containing protein [Dactylosporangium fulvum]UWP86176.1 beta-lactamase family protein [Dactylosporangium fulvum]